MLLPCKHEKELVEQVQPTINLLTGLDELHPEILREQNIQPEDYHGRLVFRSAVESIRGTFISSSVSSREGLIENILRRLSQRSDIAEYERTGSHSRHDFTILIQRENNYLAALEVKGGEGNSINISDRPLGAIEFYVWCHLDGAIVNQPGQGAHSIINRLTNELAARGKVVDALFFKDVLCGTPIRPCPKYPNHEAEIGLETAPDVFLFPQAAPSPENPQPPVHTLGTLRLPSLIFQMFGVSEAEQPRHVWEVRLRIIPAPSDRFRREVEVWHQGEMVDRSTSRAFRLKQEAEE